MIQNEHVYEICADRRYLVTSFPVIDCRGLEVASNGGDSGGEVNTPPQSSWCGHAADKGPLQCLAINSVISGTNYKLESTVIVALNLQRFTKFWYYKIPNADMSSFKRQIRQHCIFPTIPSCLFDEFESWWSTQMAAFIRQFMRSNMLSLNINQFALSYAYLLRKLRIAIKEKLRGKLTDVSLL